MSIKKTTKPTGFTIVELLIVIVVIAILAAITVVAYNGIQDRTRSSIVQSDLANAKKRLLVFKVENGRFPLSVADLLASELSISGTSNYDARSGYYNFYYCADTSGTEFAIGTRIATRENTSASVISSGGIANTGGMTSQASTCSLLGLPGSGAADGAFSVWGLNSNGTTVNWLKSTD